MADRARLEFTEATGICAAWPLVLETLQSLKPTELFFFVDEMGPVRVKRYGGQFYFAKKGTPIFVDRQTSKGSVTLVGALSATTNQVCWFYDNAKNTSAMIDLVPELAVEVT